MAVAGGWLLAVFFLSSLFGWSILGVILLIGGILIALLGSWYLVSLVKEVRARMKRSERQVNKVVT